MTYLHMLYYENSKSKSSKWTGVKYNVLMLTDEQLDWLIKHKGGEFGIDYCNDLILFENPEDAAWFKLKWL